MEFSVFGPHSAAAWRDWQRRNVEVADGAGARIATRDGSVYLDPTRVLGESTGRAGDAGARSAADAGPTAADAAAPDVIDVASDDCGHQYILAGNGDGEVYHHVPGDGVVDRLDCLFADGGEARAVAATAETLYVARGEPAAVYAYSRELGQVRWIRRDGVVDPVTFVRDGADLYLLDRGDRPGTGRLVSVDGAAGVEPVVTGLYEPVDAAVDDDGSLYVLEPQLGGDEEGFLVRRVDRRALDRPPVPAAGTVWIPPGAFRIRDTGEPFVPACIAVGAGGELLAGVAPDAGGERWLLGYRPDAAAFEYHARFPQGCLVLSPVRAAGRRRLFVVDGRRRLFGLDATEATRRDRATGGFEGALRTRLDAGERGTQWHRLRLDVERETDTAVRLHYRATDDATPEPVAVGPGTVRGRLQEIDGIGTRTAWRLRRAGVTDLAALAERSPETVATILGVEEIRVETDKVRDWQTEAASLRDDGAEESALEEVDGIGPVRASRLRAGGVGTLAEFVSLDADVLAALLGRELRSVSTNRTEQWIETARERLAELPGEPDFRVDDDWTTVATSDPRDVLLEAATGRYLWVQLDLVGTAYDSPAVRSLDASYPRQSYLRELPAVYREDEASSAFLERFLALFEGVFTDLEAGIDELTGYLDPAGAAPEHLSWLGSFLATEADDGWPTAARREFVDRAPELYRKRGTRRGLLEAIELYLDHVDVERRSWERARRRERDRLDGLVERGYLSSAERAETLERHAELAESDDGPLVRVLERGELECIDDDDAGEFYSRLVGCPGGFLVLCHPALDDAHVEAIGRIVRSQRPAHASGRAVALRQLTVLPGAEGARGAHSYLGINTALRSPEFELEEATLGRETRLGSREPHAALGLRARLDEDARIS